MVDLFAPITVGRLTIRNRFMRSATAERRSDPDGTPLPALAKYMVPLARGGVGLIVVGHTFVRPDGKASVGMAGIWRDDQVPAFTAVARAAHDNGALIAVQINHAGVVAKAAITGHEVVGPSNVALHPEAPLPRPLGEEEIESLIEAYGQAARRVREAGFDAVQIHGAHGYLVSQFLSPAINRRTDCWGGSAENRTRLLREIAKRVRTYVGAEYPVLVKLGVADFVPGGLSLDDGAAIAAQLASWGIDLVEISSGVGGTAAATGIKEPSQEAYFLPWARRVRQQSSLPLALVGGIRSLGIMQGIVDEGAADLISLSRPLIREPDLVEKLRAQASSTCTSCNLCLQHNDKPTRCWAERG